MATRVAALYDIHGNLPALEAVLDDVRVLRVERILIGGDVFPGPMALEVLHRLRTLDVPIDYIRGNGDRNLVEVAEGREAIGLPPAFLPLFEWHVGQLDRTDVQAVATWPLTSSIDTLGKVLFCHATPRDDNEMFNATTPAERLAPAFAGVVAEIVVCGHTHRQFDRMVGDLRVVNAGSVGMPFSGSGAEWLLLGETIELRRTAYDVDAARRDVLATHYPRKEEFVQVALR